MRKNISNRNFMKLWFEQWVMSSCTPFALAGMSPQQCLRFTSIPFRSLSFFIFLFFFPSRFPFRRLLHGFFYAIRWNYPGYRFFFFYKKKKTRYDTNNTDNTDNYYNLYTLILCSAGHKKRNLSAGFAQTFVDEQI